MIVPIIFPLNKMLRFYGKPLLLTRHPIFTLKNSIAQEANFEVQQRARGKIDIRIECIENLETTNTS